MRANSGNGKRTLAIVVTLVMVVSFGLPVIASFASHPAAAAPLTTGTTAAVSPPSTGGATHVPKSPHPGTLEIYEVTAGGATAEDPAVAYDTVSYEPILNTFETLITYNGSSSNGAGPNAFVPVLATCVPGTAGCQKDYGTSLLVNNGAGQPTYWTFVIDPAANFYDPNTGKSWGVYPTDVMFSVAREVAYAQSIGVGNTPGWLVAQALMPNGTGTFDGGIHAPYNNTPNQIYSSMLINDSTYCPSAAMTSAHGCITFIADGQGGPWPQFLQLIGDGFMGTLSCGWYSAHTAAVPGWSGNKASQGDAPCLLPNGGTTTQSSSWTSFVSGINPTSWDTFEELLASTYPAPAPGVQWNMVGSGPYYTITDPNGSPAGYSELANPAYGQPSGCSGAGGLATYGGYCYPAPGKYIGNVSVTYQISSDTLGVNAYKAGTADLAAFLTTDIGEMVTLAAEGKLNYYVAPTLSTFFLPYNFDWSPSAYKTAGLSGYSTITIPADFFTGAAARGLLNHAFPYTTAEVTANIVDGVQLAYMAGGPIAEGMTYYPTNITYPFTVGNPITNPSVVNSAAWWWKVGTTPGSGYYDPALAQCLNTTCVFPIIGELGATNLDIMIGEWTTEIESITGNHIQPFTYDLPFGGAGSLLSFQLGGEGPGAAPLPLWNLGWAADNFDPEDYMIPLAFPDSTYTYGDAVNESLAATGAAICGHASVPGVTNATDKLANLIYWAKQPALNSTCEGVAYQDVNAMWYASTHTTDPTLRGLIYWAIQSITNNLNMYTFFGQSNQVTSVAPWILGSSLNFNPTVGGGNDQYWFQVQYVPYETPVKFTETGLPSGSTFSVSAGAPGAIAATNNSNGTTAVGFNEPNGTLDYSFTGPAGFAVALVKGPTGTTTHSTTISGAAAGTTLTVEFVPTYALTFSASGLAPNTPWSVTLNWAATAKTGPPNGNPADGSMTLSSSSSSITVNLTKGSWKFSVAGPSYYKVSPSAGGVGVTKATTKTVKFTLLASKVTFSEAGLAKGTTWTVSVTGGPAGPDNNCTASGSSAALKCLLISGTYNVVVSATGYTATYSATITVVAPKGLTEKVTFTKA